MPDSTSTPSLVVDVLGPGIAKAIIGALGVGTFYLLQLVGVPAEAAAVGAIVAMCA